MESFELLPHFVDDYLGFLYEIRPTAATFDGVHTHDDLLEDYARGQIERQRRDLGGFARRLAAIRVDSLNEADRLDRAMLEADIRAPPLFVKTALETLRGLLTFLDVDLPRAFSALDDLSVLSDLADVSTEAHSAIAGYIEYLEQEVAPKTRASFRLGDALFAQKLQTEEGIPFELSKLLAIGERELAATQEQFREMAAR